MLFSLVYFLVRRLSSEPGGRRPDEKDIELLVLRHQVKVLQRQVKHLHLNRLDLGPVGGGEQGADEEQLVLLSRAWPLSSRPWGPVDGRRIV